MIRPAVVEDIETIVRLGRHTFEDSPYKEVTIYDPESTAYSLSALVDNPLAAFVVAEEKEIVGMACAIVAPFYFNSSAKLAQELFWWLEPGYRHLLKCLLYGMEKESAKRGADLMVIPSLCDSVGRFYRRNGYQPSEQYYMKRLSWA